MYAYNYFLNTRNVQKIIKFRSRTSVGGAKAAILVSIIK